MRTLAIALAFAALGCGGSGGGGDDGGPGGDGGVHPDGPPPGTPLGQRITVTTVSAPAGVTAGDSSFRIWGQGSLRIAPVYTTPAADCGTLIGYTTLFGDSACAFNPIGDLYKSQVRQVAASIGVPDQIIRKAPSADLWPGQTDESEADFSYPVLDRLLYWRVDRRRTDEEVAALGFDPALVARVDRLIATSEFKRQVPPIAKLGPRTAGVDYLYPRRRPGSARR